MSLVVPAVLPSSREDLEEQIALFAGVSSITRMQIDVVDGRFAEPASWPYTAFADLRDMVKRKEMLPHLDRLAYEIDFMCLDVEQAIEDWLALGATRLTLHAEGIIDLPRFLTFAKKHYGTGVRFVSDLVSFGVAINVASDLALLEPCLGDIEYVQFMGIARIGRQGQPFDHRVIEKVRTFHTQHPEVAIQVDGGISFGHAKELVALGVSHLVVGSALARNPAAEVARFEALKSSFGV